MTLLKRPSTIFDITMLPEEFEQIRGELQLNNAEMARLLGVDGKTVFRWLSSEHSIPVTAARFLRLLSEAKISGVKAARLIDRRLGRLREAA